MLPVLVARESRPAPLERVRGRRVRVARCQRTVVEHEVDRLGSVEPVREAGVIRLRQGHYKLARLLNEMAHGHASLRQHARRHLRGARIAPSG